jgi:hypothetical protein
MYGWLTFKLDVAPTELAAFFCVLSYKDFAPTELSLCVRCARLLNKMAGSSPRLGQVQYRKCSKKNHILARHLDTIFSTR